MLDLLANRSAERVTRRAVPGRWSAIEVVDHVQLVERSVVRLLLSPPPDHQVRLHEAMPARVLRTLPPAWRLWSLARRYGSAEAPARVRPRELPAPSGVLAAAGEARAEVHRFLDDVRPEALARIRRTHPVLGEFDGIEWIEFLAAHEARHLLQLREALR